MIPKDATDTPDRLDGPGAQAASPELPPSVRASRLRLGYGTREVLHGLDLEIPRGQFLVVLGSSGSGKSTLLLALNGSLPPLSGSLEVLGQDLSKLRGSPLERLRSRIGFIFQSFHLVGRVTVLHNVASGLLSEIPLLFSLLQWYTREQYARILEALRIVGLEGRALERCDRLSGGQRQRVAIARSLVQKPEILLADEPVSALDPRSARRVLEILRRASRELGITVVCNLHHLEAAREFPDRVIGLSNGHVVYDGPPAELDDAAIRAIYHSDEPPSTEDGTLPEP